MHSRLMARTAQFFRTLLPPAIALLLPHTHSYGVLSEKYAVLLPANTGQSKESPYTSRKNFIRRARFSSYVRPLCLTRFDSVIRTIHWYRVDYFRAAGAPKMNIDYMARFRDAVVAAAATATDDDYFSFDRAYISLAASEIAV